MNITQLPCEICKKSIDASQFAIHQVINCEHNIYFEFLLLKFLRDNVMKMIDVELRTKEGSLSFQSHCTSLFSLQYTEELNKHKI